MNDSFSNNRHSWRAALTALAVIVLASYASGAARAEDGFAAIVPEGAQPVDDAQATLEAALAEDEVIRFQCRNGQFAGGDFDSALELRAGGEAKLIDYGFAVIEHPGTYEVNDDNELVVTFENRPGWPAVVVYDDSGKLVLIPASGTPDSVSEHEGLPVAEYAVTVWPFRQVAGP